MSPADNFSIHRHLDEAFNGVAATPDVQDLKEEIRANLAARAGELEATGVSPADAAVAAVREFGDIRTMIRSLDGADAADANPSPTAARPDAATRNRVRPNPDYAVRTTFLSIFAVASAALLIVGDLPLQTFGAVLAALAVAVIVADGLLQETTSSYPLPAERGLLYGLAAGGLTLGVCFLGVYFGDVSQFGFIVMGSALTLGSTVTFVWLGVTQTNRKKARSLR